MIFTLLYDVVLGIPVSLAKQVLLKLTEEIDRERLVTEESIKGRLQQLQILLQDGELEEEEYDRLETQLIERLRAVREYRNERGRTDGDAT